MRSSPKLAQEIASKLEAQIIRSGWKVGSALGSEAELAHRFGVSRWVMREAISIARHHGLLQIKRGRNGGIEVAAPALDAVDVSLRSYLMARRISADELLEAREVFENLAIDLAMNHAKRSALSRDMLQQVVDDSDRMTADNSLAIANMLKNALLNVCSNPVFVVFFNTLSKITQDLSIYQNYSDADLNRTTSALAKIRREQLQTILDGDAVHAKNLIRNLIARMRHFSSLPRGDVASAMSAHANGVESFRRRGIKLSEKISRQLLAEIVLGELPAGHLLGREADLMERFGVSRAMLREAIRPLERLGVVDMRRGGNTQGLVVGEPDASAVTKSIVLYLNHAMLDKADALEILRPLLLHAVNTECRKSKTERHDYVQAAREIMEGVDAATAKQLTAAARSFWSLLIGQLANPILSLFIRIIDEAFLIVPHGDAAATGISAGATLRRRYERLLKAIEAGNASDATGAMARIFTSTSEIDAQLKSAAQVVGNNTTP